MTPRCPLHPSEPASACFSCYLSQPCDECDHTATHNGTSKATGKRGQFCNGCMDWDKPGFARND